MILAALTPLLAVLGLLVLARLPAAQAMPLSLAVTAVVSVAVWDVPVRHALAAALEGLVIAASILWIVFGAILLLKLLQASGAMAAIRDGFMVVSSDLRAQVILIAWLFGAFLEGAAGFGTPAAITAPLLTALGLQPLGAVVLALIADTTPVSFGAIGTPVVVGLAQGLQDGARVSALAANALGDASLPDFLQGIAVQALAIDLVVGSSMPLLIVIILTRYFQPSRSWQEGLAAWRFAVAAGLSFTVPALGVALLLGPEFPSLIGALIGLGIMVPIARKGLLLPHSPRLRDSSAVRGAVRGRMSPARAWTPYLLLAVLLVATRIDELPLKAPLQAATISWEGVLGTGVAVSIAPLYLPGTVFIVIALVTVRLHGISARGARGALRDTTNVLAGSTVALGAAVPMVRIFIHSGVNDSGLASMPMVLAASAADATGGAWPLVAPFVGALGSFLAGSTTFSNMMFALVQVSAAEQSGVSPTLVLAAQMIGANAGNMISVPNVVAAAAVVGLLRKEGTIIRFTLGPMLYYCLAAGTLAFLFSRW